MINQMIWDNYKKNKKKQQQRIVNVITLFKE